MIYAGCFRYAIDKHIRFMVCFYDSYMLSVLIAILIAVFYRDTSVHSRIECDIDCGINSAYVCREASDMLAMI